MAAPETKLIDQILPKYVDDSKLRAKLEEKLDGRTFYIDVSISCSSLLRSLEHGVGQLTQDLTAARGRHSHQGPRRVQIDRRSL